MVAVAGMVALTGCAGGDSKVTDREILIEIEPQGPEGTTGTLSLSKSGDSTNVVTDVIVPSGGGQQGAAFYKGTCTDFDEASAIDVGPLQEGSWALTLDRPIEDILEGGYVIAITKTPDDDTVIACAPIETE